MEPHGSPRWEPMALPLNEAHGDAVALPSCLADRQALLLSAIRRQARLRNRAVPERTGRVVHLVTPRAEEPDGLVPPRFTVATVTQIGSHTGRSSRQTPRPTTPATRDDPTD